MLHRITSHMPYFDLRTGNTIDEILYQKDNSMQKCNLASFKKFEAKVSYNLSKEKKIIDSPSNRKISR